MAAMPLRQPLLLPRQQRSTSSSMRLLPLPLLLPQQQHRLSQASISLLNSSCPITASARRWVSARLARQEATKHQQHHTTLRGAPCMTSELNDNAHVCAKSFSTPTPPFTVRVGMHVGLGLGVRVGVPH